MTRFQFRRGLPGFSRTGDTGADAESHPRSPRCRPVRRTRPSPSRRAPRRTRTNRCARPGLRRAACSGDMYATVPRALPGCVVRSLGRPFRRVDCVRRLSRRALARPKSRILARARSRKFRRLDVAMDDALAVRGIQGIGDGDGEVNDDRDSIGPRGNVAGASRPRAAPSR